MKANRDTAVDVWIRYDWLFSVVFYLVTLAPALLYLREPSSRPLALLIIVLLWLLHALLLLPRLRDNRGNVRGGSFWLRLIYIVTLVLGWMLLVALSPLFYFMLFTLFAEINRWLPSRFSAGLVLVVIVGYFWSTTDYDWRLTLAPNQPFLWIALLAFFATMLFARWVEAIIVQSDERRRLIAELHQTQSQLAAAERQQGVLQERQRLAREIHDTLAQGFTSIVMHLEAAEALMQPPQPRVQHHIDLARQTARDSLTQARRVIADLLPLPLVEQAGLAEAIAQSVTRWGQSNRIDARFKLTGAAERLHPEIEVTVLRALQEALNNVLKHAQATSVIVTLSYMEHTLMLDVKDNGVGIDNALTGDDVGGYGLSMMRARVAELGGQVLLESTPATGTTLVVQIPLVQKEPQLR